MFDGKFESPDEALTSLRSLALVLTLSPVLGGQVSKGFWPNLLSRLLSDESGKGRASLLRNLFFVLPVVGCQRSVVTINSRHSIENEIPGSATRIAVDVQILVFYATDHEHRLLVRSFPSHFLAKYSCKAMTSEF